MLVAAASNAYNAIPYSTACCAFLRTARIDISGQVTLLSDGWTTVSGHGSDYLLDVDNQLTFPSLVDFCQGSGSAVVSVDSAEEWSALKEILQGLMDSGAL